MSERRSRFSRRTAALLWMLGVAVIIGVLIAYEQISVLYVLTTLAIVALLVIVAFSDLEKVSRTDQEPSSRTKA
jgi:membrane protein implicated in regulation of membrane protease activity